MIPTEEKNKTAGRTNARVGPDSLYKYKCRGVDARILIPTSLIPRSKATARLITAIADHALAITANTGKAVAAGGTGLKELRRFGVGHDGDPTYAALFNTLPTLTTLFSRNRDIYFVSTTIEVFPPPERVGDDVNSKAKPCIPWDPAAPTLNIFPVTEAVIMDPIDTTEGFLRNASPQQMVVHHDYASARHVEEELCERDRKCTLEFIRHSDGAIFRQQPRHD